MWYTLCGYIYSGVWFHRRCDSRRTLCIGKHCFCGWRNTSLYFFISLISLKSWPISLTMDLDHFGLSWPLISCLYSWDVPISENMAVLTRLVWMSILPVEIFVSIQFSTLWCTSVLAGVGVDICLGWEIHVTWLDMRLWPLGVWTLYYICVPVGLW